MEKKDHLERNIQENPVHRIKQGKSGCRAVELKASLWR